MSAAMFQRFMEKAPVTVMVRSTLERVLSPAAIDSIFANSAVRQVEGELLFSSVVELLALVVWRQRDSINQAYQQAREDFEVSVRSVYNKLKGRETQVCRALVRETAGPLEEIVAALGPDAQAATGRLPHADHRRQSPDLDGASSQAAAIYQERTVAGPGAGSAGSRSDADRRSVSL
jgi:hypothetical protein